MSAKRSFLSELKRRHVLRAGVLYIGVMWALSQGAAQLLPVFDVPNWIVRAFVIAGVVGFPFWLVLAWLYELTPEGLKRESAIAADAAVTQRKGRRLDVAIIGVLSIVVVLLLTERFVQRATDAAAKAGSVAALIQSYGDRSIAVLPFVNLSGDAEQGYFAEGIAEDVLNQLTRVGQLRVIARTSSFSFKTQNLDVAEIARRLKCANVLQGSVRKLGNRVRVSAQLIRAVDAGQLWSENYDRDESDLFAVQDDISTAVATQLKLKLLAGVESAPKRAVDARAYPLYLQGRELGRLATKEGFDRAEQVLREAVSIDPNYAAAWDQLAFVYEARGVYGFLPHEEAVGKARDLIARALAADPKFAPAIARLGEMADSAGDLKTAADQAQRALAIDPANRIVLAIASDVLMDIGRKQESVAITDYLLAQDPVNAIALSTAAGSYIAVQRYDDAIAAARTSLTLTPGRPSAILHLADALLLSGKAAQAQEAVAQIKAEDYRKVRGIMSDHLLHHDAAVDKALGALADDYSRKREAKDGQGAAVIAYELSQILAFRGAHEHAFEWLEKIDATETAGWTSTSYDPYLSMLRGDRRWTAFLDRIGQGPQQLAKIKLEVTLPHGHTTPDPSPADS